MFQNFLQFFNVDYEYNQSQDPYTAFMEYFGGKQFGNGLLRIFEKDDVQNWQNTVTNAYPHFANQFTLFAYDWLGRCFAIDHKENTSGNILMFEIGTHDVLAIPCSFTQFLNEEIPVYHEACLASNFYHEWMNHTDKSVAIDRCIGYKIPLYLGGEDTIENLEDINMDVYWNVFA